MEAATLMFFCVVFFYILGEFPKFVFNLCFSKIYKLNKNWGQKWFLRHCTKKGIEA